MNKLLGALALTLLPLSAAAATASSADAVTPGHTAVTLIVKGCDGCKITASSWKRLHTHPWTSVARTVRNGEVTFYPPTARTAGLSFMVSDRHAVNDGAVPNIVLRYAGKRVGQDVTPRAARRGTAGYICWNGTTQNRAEILVTVDRFPGHALDGTPGYAIRPYADPGIRTIGDRRHLGRGLYETQDIPVCYGD